MLEIQAPDFGVENVVRACGDAQSVKPLIDGVETLKLQEVEYLARITGGTVHDFPMPFSGVTDLISTAANTAYTSRLRSKAWDARAFYDYMRLTAPNGICPNCMVRDAAALDHHLPREHYPALAIQPSNLVPTCTACNLKKSSDVATTADDRFLHPYFDRLGSWGWLKAAVIEIPGSPLKFRVERSGEWDDVTYARVKKHFERFSLLRVYGEKSAGLLGNLRVAFESHWDDAPAGSGAAVVSREAHRLSRSFASMNRSPWQAVALSSWADSDWFCGGGWRTPDDHSALAAARARLRL